METKYVDVEAAYNATDLAQFMDITFPPEWGSLKSRILETGAVLSDEAMFAPKWSPIPVTQRIGDATAETHMKSMIFRVHDCIHQIWGLPVPQSYDEPSRREFKKMWMCAEMSVLTITEFFYTQWLYDTQPHLRSLLEKRNTLLFKNSTRLRYLSMKDTAVVLDQVLHQVQSKKIPDDVRPTLLPHWVRENTHAMIFVEDFGAMFRQDRVNIDCNWELLRRQTDRAYLAKLPNQTYSTKMDGLQLTVWMIGYFETLLGSGEDVDVELMMFNRRRREGVNLPARWNEGVI